MIARACRENLLAIAVAYARAMGVTLEHVSKKFYGNRDFLRDFRQRDVSMSLDKFDEMIAAFSKAWPPGVRWPLMRAAVIERPKRKISPAKKSGVVQPDANRVDGARHETEPGRRGRGRAHPA